MQKWMISANGNMYNHASAFQKWGFIDWRQKVNYEEGDIVYIYCTRPYKRVMYKTVVEKESMSVDEIVDDKKYWFQIEEYEKALDGKYARLRLIEQVDSDKLVLEKLKLHGLKSAPQGPIKVCDSLGKYIETYIHSASSSGIFPEEDFPENSYEGAMKQILVNKYERSSIARQKCIEYYGYKCNICGMDFEENYGDIGKGFIHVHHLVPLNKIGKEYVVDYKKDLIPVCPNCHAMLHRTLNGKEVSVEDLKRIISLKNKEKG